MSNVDILAECRAIGIKSSPESFGALLADLTKSRASPAQVIEQLVALERKERDAANLASRTRSAALGPFKQLDRFDWNHPRIIDRALIDELLRLAFITKAENILLRGPSGVGKTNLAQILAHEALRAGFTVRFTTLAAALSDIIRQESVPALERRLHKYTDVDLLILDELGYLPCDNRAGDILYNIISRRHEKRPTVITTNIPYKQWTSVFPGAACVGALVDRFAQHCHQLDIDADSWRHKEASAAKKTTKRS